MVSDLCNMKDTLILALLYVYFAAADSRQNG